MGHIAAEILIQKAAKIKLLALDVDGVLTPGDITYTSSGEQVQSFSVRDGFGMRQLLEAGIAVVIVTSRASAAVERRAAELGLTKVYQGVGDKGRVFAEILEEFRLSSEEVAYVGDDWVDLPILKRAGLSVVPADAAQPLSDHVHMVTSLPGGKGAVREVCDLILRAKGLWGEILNRFMDGGAGNAL